MDQYIKRNDILALLQGSDTVGYKPSALREKVLALPTIRIVQEEPKEEKDADIERMEKVHGICQEICIMIAELLVEGVIDKAKGSEIVMTLAHKQTAWMKKTFAEEKVRAFVDSTKDERRMNIVGIATRIVKEQSQRTNKERLAYVHGIVGKITDKCADLTKAGVWGFSEGLDFAFALTGEQISWAQKTFPPAEVLKFMLKI